MKGYEVVKQPELDLREDDYLITKRDGQKVSMVPIQRFIDLLGGKITGFDFKIVEELPEEGEKGILYLLKLPKEDEKNNYEEYIWIGEKYELLGSFSTDVDIKNFQLVTELPSQGEENTFYILKEGGKTEGPEITYDYLLSNLSSLKKIDTITVNREEYKLEAGIDEQYAYYTVTNSFSLDIYELPIKDNFWFVKSYVQYGGYYNIRRVSSKLIAFTSDYLNIGDAETTGLFFLEDKVLISFGNSYLGGGRVNDGNVYANEECTKVLTFQDLTEGIKYSQYIWDDNQFVQVSSGDSSREITQAEYDELPESEKDSDTTFFIPDGDYADLPESRIDDNMTADSMTWSSENIQAQMSQFVVDTTLEATPIRNVRIPEVCRRPNATSFKVFFNHGWDFTEDETAAMQLNVPGIGVKYVKVYKSGSKVNIVNQGDAGTVLELFYDGTDFVVIGNPLVKSSNDSTSGFSIYADGRFKQWTHMVLRKNTLNTDLCFTPIGNVKTLSITIDSFGGQPINSYYGLYSGGQIYVYYNNTFASDHYAWVIAEG